MDLKKHIERQKEWSAEVIGPGIRTSSICDHIRKELEEIEANPTDVIEWADVVMLALDGAWRAGHSSDEICAAIESKQSKNESRKWPDWRKIDTSKPVEHIRDS